jgi:hypothetical protein
VEILYMTVMMSLCCRNLLVCHKGFSSTGEGGVCGHCGSTREVSGTSVHGVQ